MVSPSCFNAMNAERNSAYVSVCQKCAIDEHPNELANEGGCGSIVVIENTFHYKQVLPLHMGDNVIGRYVKGTKADIPIETADPSIDMHHCIINVSREKNGRLKYILRDAPSYTGTFVDNVVLRDRERRIITDGTLFTIGATSVILRAAESSSM